MIAVIPREFGVLLLGVPRPRVLSAGGPAPCPGEASTGVGIAGAGLLVRPCPDYETRRKLIWKNGSSS